ncbi:MAG: TRAP transporter permease [Synergistaceae bacterium]|jgi:TRAP transporter 4TM/12TM fusion protein|nr:TRAP transporter permease [Synergistaceae bacterium]
MPNDATPAGALREEISQAKAEEVLEQIDKESSFRRYAGVWAKVVAVIATCMSIYHLVTSSGYWMLPSMHHQSVHLTFLLILAFLLYPAFGKKQKGSAPSCFDLIWLVVSAASSIYILLCFDEFSIRGTAIPRDLIMGGILIVCVLEATRRSVGKELMILALVFLAYGFWGDLIPGMLGHTGFTVRRIVYQTYLTSEGIFGVALSVSATYIFLFILFGSFLAETGMGGFIKDFAMCIAGRTIGGEAKVAIVTCGLMGMINGSAVGNVAATGTFTIPLMRSAGFKPVFSAALVAAAGTGGMIMPPVMGAASFIMAEYLGVHYSKIMLAAAIPAILYYISQYAYVHVEAKKLGMTRTSSENIIPLMSVMRTQGYMIVPIAVIIYLLLIGRTPLYSAFYGIVSSVGVTAVAGLVQDVATFWVSYRIVGVSAVAELPRGKFVSMLKAYMRALEQGARQCVSVGVACAVVGIINSITNLTSLGFVFGNAIVSLAAGSIILTAVMTMLLSIILGMGLPTTACYIITATIAAPALIKLKIDPLAAHMFAYYFACLSNLTPPVAIASYGAAGLSGQNPSEVGWAGFRIALPGFVIPFTFIYAPALLFVNSTLPEIALAGVTALVGVIAAATALQDYLLKPLGMFFRILLFAGSLLLIFPGLETDIAGLAIVLGIGAFQKFGPENQNPE